MADNVSILDAAAAVAAVAADEIGGVKHQRVKIEWGADGTVNDVSAASPLPITAPNPLLVETAPAGFEVTARSAGGRITAYTVTYRDGSTEDRVVTRDPTTDRFISDQIA